MTMEGTLHTICPAADIRLKDGGAIRKGGFVIALGGSCPRPVYFEVMGEEPLRQLSALAPGVPLRVHFYPESREGRGGRYFTSLRCTGVVSLAPPQAAEPQLRRPVRPDAVAEALICPINVEDAPF